MNKTTLNNELSQLTKESLTDESCIFNRLVFLTGQYIKKECIKRAEAGFNYIYLSEVNICKNLSESYLNVYRLHADIALTDIQPVLERYALNENLTYRIIDDEHRKYLISW